MRHRNGKMRPPSSGEPADGRNSQATGESGESPATPVVPPTWKAIVLDAFDRYERPLTAYALRFYGGRQGDLHAARDAVQHTFMQLCKQSPETVAHKLAPWLFTVCRNRMLDEAGSRDGQLKSSPADFDAIDERADDPSARVELDELLQRVQQLMLSLAASEREVIELWSHGFSSNEIGEIIGKPAGTVRVQLYRAIKRLQQHPEVSIWLERATGQEVTSMDDRSIIGQSKFGSLQRSINSNPATLPSIKGETS